MSFYEKKNDNKKIGRWRRLWRRLAAVWERFCNERNWRWSQRLLTALLAVGLAVGGFAQAVRSSDNLSDKIYLGENWYGEKYVAESAAADDEKVWGNVTLELMDFTTLPGAKVLKNGEEVREFREQRVTVRVEYGDVIAVDTTAYEAPVRVRIASVSSVIDVRDLQEVNVISCERKELGKIIFR